MLGVFASVLRLILEDAAGWERSLEHLSREFATSFALLAAPLLLGTAAAIFGLRRTGRIALGVALVQFFGFLGFLRG